MKSSTRYVVLGISGAVLAFIAGMILAPTVFGTPRFVSSVGAASVPVEMPDVVGLSRQEAQREIESSSLVLAGQWSEYGPMETMGTVIRQDPPPGTLTPRGTPVSIFWNIGPLFRTFHPDSLLGMTAVEAEEKIADWQLYSMGRSRVPHPVVPAGVVVAVCPRQYDSLPVTTSVRLLVSSGWEGMPRFLDMTVEQAEELARERDLFLVVKEKPVEDLAMEGIVVEQQVPPGTAYEKGDSITVLIGKVGLDWGAW